MNRQALLEKWAPVINSEHAPAIKDAQRRGLIFLLGEGGVEPPRFLEQLLLR